YVFINNIIGRFFSKEKPDNSELPNFLAKHGCLAKETFRYTFWQLVTRLFPMLLLQKPDWLLQEVQGTQRRSQ
ncbi:hypothetical protein A5876_002501, partial [Enterococcus sp. 3C8_DIV0646]